MATTDERGVARLSGLPPEVDLLVTSPEGDPVGAGYGLRVYVAPPTLPTVRLTADLGVPGDGHTPVSKIIPRALMGVAPGSRVIFDAPRYHIPTTLLLSSLPTDLLLSGEGTTLFRGADDPVLDEHLVEVELYIDLMMEDFTIQGNNPDWRYSHETEFSSAIRVRGGTGFTMRRLTARNVGGDGFNVIGGAGTGLARRVLLEGADLAYCARQGVAIRNAEDVRIHRVIGQWIGRSFIDVEPLPGHVTLGVVVEDCFCTHFRNSFLAAGGAAPIESLRFARNRGVGGLQFAAAGAQYPVGHLEITGNTYTWDDPDYRQDRALGRVNLAAENLIFTDNDLTFNTPPGGQGCLWRVASSGSVRRSRLAGVGNRHEYGLLIDTGGRPGIVEVNEVAVTDRNGAPLQVVVR